MVEKGNTVMPKVQSWKIYLVKKMTYIRNIMHAYNSFFAWIAGKQTYKQTQNRPPKVKEIYTHSCCVFVWWNCEFFFRIKIALNDIWLGECVEYTVIITLDAKRNRIVHGSTMVTSQMFKWARGTLKIFLAFFLVLVFFAFFFFFFFYFAFLFF